MKKDINGLTKKLIRARSVTGDSKESKKALDIVSEFLGSGIKSKTFTKNGFESRLWSTGKNILKPDILFSGHLDVVDADTDKLFVPAEDNGKLVGRGAGDMKGPAAAMCVAFKKLSEKNFNLGLLLSTDEEMGGFNGTRHALDSGLKPKIVFLPDGGENFNIVDSEKAPHHFVFRSESLGGHASRAFEIENPINNILSFYNDVRKNFSKASKSRPWASTFEITTIKTSNTAKNKIPSDVEAAFSWRWPLEQITFLRGRGEILRLAKKHNLTVVDEEGGGEGTLIMNNKIIKIWKREIEIILTRKVKFVHTHGASDARHFYNHKNGTKNIIITSVVSGGHHATNEWVNIDSLEILAKTLIGFVEKSLTH